MSSPIAADHGQGTARSVPAADALARLACPLCRGTLRPEAHGLRCGACDRRFPIDRGVIRFVDADPFYEGAYDATIRFTPSGGLLSELGLYLLSTHYLWWVRRHVERGARLVELGAGGGVTFFSQHARTTAIDLSFGSLAKLDAGYELALQADALHLPLRDQSYDALVSAYFFEHVSPADKPRLLAEIRRVLRPGGRAVLLFDVACHNPLFRWFRRDAERFQQCFVEHDHHYGLETASANTELFEACGFRVLDQHLANKTPIQPLSVYTWAKPYGRPLTSALATAADFVSARPRLCQSYGVALTVLDDIVEPLLPSDWARIMLVALERS